MSPFRWKNCYADVKAWRHGLTVTSYLDKVVLPAITLLENRITELGRNEEPAAAFIQADMVVVLRETKKAFGLAIQSIWERQLRDYLKGCAAELKPAESLADKIGQARWADLCALFVELRGIRLDAFPSYNELETLHHLGNACRHGNGPSAVKLARRCPDLWPEYAQVSPIMDTAPATSPPSVENMDIPTDRLRAFVTAISNFWDDATYIYNESIERKHPSLETRLARERAERSWLPQVDDKTD